MKVYLDSCVYIDHFDGRVDKLRPLGEFAFEVLRRCLSCEFEIVFSSLVYDELIFNNYEKRIKELILDFEKKDKIIRVEVKGKDRKKAKILSKKRRTHYNDTLHAVVANRIKSDYLITRNVKDFFELQDLVKLSLPELL